MIVVADMVGSVALFDRDEAGTARRWTRLVNDIETRVLPATGGRLVKSTGDGFILEFGDVSSAMRCSAEIHRAFAAASAGTAPELAMAARVGVHVADVYASALDIFGRGVNLAARLGSLGRPGETIVSAELRDRLVPGLDCDVEDIGASFFKHAAEPVCAFRVVGDGTPEPRWLGADPQLALQSAIAVVPFEARLVDPAFDAAGEMLADSIIAKLSGCSRLRVISRLSTSKLRGRSLGTRSVGSVLGADFTLGGSYRMAGTQILLIAELAATTDAEVLWVREYRCSIHDLLVPDAEIVARIAAEVADAIAARSVRRARTAPLPTLESFALLLAGTAMMHRSSPEEFRRSREILEALVDRHPRAPEPRAWLAKWYVLRVTRGLAEAGSMETGRALEQTRRALDAEPDCSLALAIEGFVHIHMSRDLDLAERRIDDSISVNPNEALGWLFRSVTLGFKGEGPVSLAAAETALRLSPIDPMHHYFDALASAAAIRAGDFARASSLAVRALRINRNHLPTLRCLAIAQVETGNPEEARKSVGRILELDPQFTIARYLARAPTGTEAKLAMYTQALREAGVPER